MQLDHFATEANLFFKEVANELDNPLDEAHAYRVTRSTFHTLRDMLTPEESAHLIAQLPMYLKAVYVDGWNLRQAKNKIRSMSEFLECIRANNEHPERDFGNDASAKAKVQAVFAALQQKVTTGEIIHILDQMPEELTELWKAPAREKP